MRLIGLVWGLQMVYGFGTRVVRARRTGAPARQRDRRRGADGGGLRSAGWPAACCRPPWRGSASSTPTPRRCSTRARWTASAACCARSPACRRCRGPRAPESLAHLWVAEAASGRRIRLAALAGDAPADRAAPGAALRPPGRRAGGAAAAAAARRAPAGDGGVGAGRRRRAAARDPRATHRGEPAARRRRRRQRRRAMPCSARRYWHGRGERHAALLAWLIADDAAHAPWSAWRERAGSAAFVERVREDWLALGPAARQQVFEALVARTVEAGADDRAALLRCGARPGAPRRRAAAPAAAQACAGRRRAACTAVSAWKT